MPLPRKQHVPSRSHLRLLFLLPYAGATPAPEPIGILAPPVREQSLRGESQTPSRRTSVVRQPLRNGTTALGMPGAPVATGRSDVGNDVVLAQQGGRALPRGGMTQQQQKQQKQQKQPISAGEGGE